jgi:hypothetical protein
MTGLGDNLECDECGEPVDLGEYVRCHGMHDDCLVERNQHN